MSQNSFESDSRRAFTQRRKTKKKTFFVFSCGPDLSLGQITQREERLREKKECPKIHLNLPQAELSQREERLRKKNLFCVFMRTDLSLGQITQREERLREIKENVQIKIHQDLPNFHRENTYITLRVPYSTVHDESSHALLYDANIGRELFLYKRLKIFISLLDELKRIINN